MSTSFLVSAVLTNAAQLLGTPSFSSTTNVSQSQALLWCNQGLQALQAIHRQKFPSERDLVQSTALQTQANLSVVSLPTNFGEMGDLLWIKDDQTVIPLEQMTRDDVTPATHDPKEWQRHPRYRLVGNVIELSPTPDRVYDLQIWHTSLNTIATTGDTVIGRLDWQRWLELYLCVQCCIRKRRKEDLAMFEQLKDKLEANMFHKGRKRDQNAPLSVRECGIYGEDDWPFHTGIW